MCLAALDATQWDDLEVIVVDNGSTDGTSETTRRCAPDAIMIRSERNLGFAGGNNLGLVRATGDVLVLLNDDCEVRADWLTEWMAAADALPDWGVLGCKLLYPGGKTIQHAGGVIEPNALTKHLGYMEPDDGRFDELRRCDYVTGAAFAIKREVMEKIGLLDPEYFPIYFEENDYCARAARAGFGVYYVPRAVVIHHESMTTKKLSFGFLCKYHRNRLRFMIKNFSAEELRRAMRQEAKWLIGHRPWDVALPLLRAYGHCLLRAPRLYRARKENLA